MIAADQHHLEDDNFFPSTVYWRMCDIARELERELANMEDQRDAAIWCHEKCREDRLRVIAQRDRLAEALQSVLNEVGDAYLACEVEVRETLAAVKGGTP